MPWQLILDITVALLLVAFIAYAVTLSHQLKELRKGRDEMERMVKTFNEATSRAEAGIPRLRKTAEDAGRFLDEHVAKARTLRDDLAYMVERADGMAARLEGAVRNARGEGKPASKDGARGVEPKGMEPRGVDPRGVETRGVEPRGGEARGVEPRGRATNSAEAWADALSDQDARLAAARPRLRTRPDGAPAPEGRGPLGGTRPLGGLDGPTDPRSESRALAPTQAPEAALSAEDERSEAERELLRALQSAR
jgi:hypothetical protein